jgi:hypothetical protein
MKKEEFKKRFKENSGLKGGTKPYQIVKEYIKRAEKSKGRYRGKIYPVIIVTKKTKVYLIDYRRLIIKALINMEIKFDEELTIIKYAYPTDYIKILTYID